MPAGLRRFACAVPAFAVGLVIGCASEPRSVSTTPVAAPPAAMASPAGSLTLTYLGVAGWQIEGAGRTILVDPYLSRPADFDAPLVPDAAAIAAHTPAKADLVLVGHSHFDHVLDAPSVAARTGAQLLGSATTAHLGRASGLTDEQIIAIKGGEDFSFGDYSVRVIPSLHSAIGDKHVFGSALAAPPTLPMPASGYPEGGAYAYLVRVGGHEVFVLGTANFIERELVGLHPDIAILAVGLREHIHDYTCRLLDALGRPPLVYVNHFDDYTVDPVGQIVNDDTRRFVDEVGHCAPGTVVVIPTPFVSMR